jgi:hypothetical protein
MSLLTALGATIAFSNGCGSGGGATQNRPPTITKISTQVTDEDFPKVVSFSVGDPDTPLDRLRLNAVSHNPALIPATNIVFSGSGPDRTMTLTPAAYQFGKTDITVEVRDGRLRCIETFSFIVNAVHGPPDIHPIDPRTTSSE